MMKHKSVRKCQRCISPAEMQMIINSRICWRDQAVWIRALIDAEYLNLNIADPIFGYAYNVPVKFTNSLRLVFGGEVSEKYSQMLSQNIILMRELIEAQEDNDTEAMIEIVNKSYYEADRRAAYLDSINPFWNEDQWRNLTYTYLFLTIEQANALLEGDYERSINIFDRLLVHADLIGDYFASGLFSYMALIPAYPSQQRINPPDGLCITYEMMSLIYNIRLFWGDVAIWARNYMVFRTADPEYAEKAYEKLKELPVEYDKTLRVVFDYEAVDALIEFTNEQIDLMVAFIEALIDGDSEETNRIVQLLYQSISKRTDLDTRMNPYLDANTWENLLHNYLNGTINMITSYLVGDYTGNLDIFQRLLDYTETLSRVFFEAMIEYLSKINPALRRCRFE